MSRSYKKVAGFVDRDPYMKNYSNRIIRGIPVTEEIADGCSYRKIMCPYNICDWRSTFHGDKKHWKKECKRWGRFWEYDEWYKWKSK